MKLNLERTFSSAHIVHTIDTKCTRLHGHNWKAIVDIAVDDHGLGVLPPDEMLVDFGDVKSLIDELDHKTILPMEIVTDMAGTPHYEVRFQVPGENTRPKYYLFPKEDVYLLKKPAATAENVATLLMEQIVELARSRLQPIVEEFPLHSDFLGTILPRMFVRVNLYETDTCSAEAEQYFHLDLPKNEEEQQPNA